MKKRLILFIAILVITLLVGWSVYSFYVITWNKVKLGIQQDATNRVVNFILSEIQNKGEITIFLESGSITLVPKVVLENNNLK